MSVRLAATAEDYDSDAASSNSWPNDDDDNKCDVYARNRKSYFPCAIDSNYGGILVGLQSAGSTKQNLKATF